LAGAENGGHNTDGIKTSCLGNEDPENSSPIAKKVRKSIE